MSPVLSHAPPTVLQSCPRCGTALPLERPVRAARLRCLTPSCHARLRIAGGRVLSA
jgi:hypothetical protein